MSVFIFSHLPRPENFHEIAWLRLIKVVEIAAKSQLVKETRSAGAIGVPSAPDPFAVTLISNDQVLQSGVIEMKFASRTQRLDRSDEHEVGCARTETG